MDIAPFDIPLPLIVIVLIVVFVLKAAKTNRRFMRETDQRLCRGCSTSHPSFASFCRRCGRRL